MTRRSKSSSRWLDEHFSDRFVKRAQAGSRRHGLAEPALEMCGEVLKPGGDALIKVFQGTGFQEFVSAARQRFGRVRFLKPEASRARSPETYLLATGRRMV